MQPLLIARYALPLLLLGIILLLTSCQDQSESVQAVTFMTYNVGNTRGDPVTLDQLASAILEAGRPDILALQQVPWGLKFRPLAEALGYEYCIERSATSPWTNLGLLSIYPLETPKTKTLDPIANEQDKTTFLCARVRIRNSLVLVCTFHLESLSPRLQEIRHNKLGLWPLSKTLFQEFFQANPRSWNAASLKHWASGFGMDKGHILLGGDLNTVPLSTAHRTMTAWLDDALWPSPAFFQGSFYDLNWPVLPRIDHIFHSKGLKVQKAKRLKIDLSDHYPLQVHFDVQDEATTGPH